MFSEAEQRGEKVRECGRHVAIEVEFAKDGERVWTRNCSMYFSTRGFKDFTKSASEVLE